MDQSTSLFIAQIPGWLTKHEGQFLEKAAFFVGRRSGVIVEIGSFYGKSTICLAQAGGKVFAVDPHKGEFSGGKTKSTLRVFLDNLKKARVNNIVTPIIKTSSDASKNWNDPVKLLFIDGLHDFDHAHEDFSLWSPHIIEGGIIAMHDAFCGWEGAGRVAMREIVYSSHFKEIGVVGSIIYGVKGKSSLWQKIHIWWQQLVIELAHAIHTSFWMPHIIRFMLVHRILRLFLVNRFTSIG